MPRSGFSAARSSDLLTLVVDRTLRKLVTLGRIEEARQQAGRVVGSARIFGMPLDTDEKWMGRKFDGIDDTTILRLAPDGQPLVPQWREKLRAQVITMRHADLYLRTTT